jgi:hypothetical protein
MRELIVPRLLGLLLVALTSAVGWCQDRQAERGSGSDAPIYGLDRYGNPTGEGLGLAPDKLQGTILAYCASSDWAKQIFHKDAPVWAALRAKGFKLEFAQGRFPRDRLEEVDQLWLFSSQKRDASRVREADYAAIVAFVERGKGLYLLSDNDDFTYESNELVGRMFGSYVRSNYEGKKVLAVTRPTVTAAMRSRYRADYTVADHALLRDINFLYEGITVSHVGPHRYLATAVAASDGQTLVAVPADGKKNVVIDCGLTRYLRDHRDKAVGAPRFAQNVAAYLMGKR